MRVIFAPLSNDFLRDWPIASYRGLVSKLMEMDSAEVQIIGSRIQRPHINEIVRPFPADRVQNLAGRTNWREAQKIVEMGDVIIANNSGIAHVAAKMGRPTLCLFAASHDPYEWMPRGAHVTTLYTATACAPCCHHGLGGCPFNKHCLRSITPAIAFDEIMKLYRGARP